MAGKLRHADPSDHPRGADGPGANAHFNRIGTGINQSFGAIRSRDVAGQNLRVIAEFLNFLELLSGYPLGVPVCGVNDNYVHICIQKPFQPLASRVTDASCCGDAEATFFVFAGIRIGLCHFHILNGRISPTQRLLAIHHHKFFNPVLVQKPFGFLQVDVFRHRDKTRHPPVVGSHEFPDRFARDWTQTERPDWSVCTD